MTSEIFQLRPNAVQDLELSTEMSRVRQGTQSPRGLRVARHGNPFHLRGGEFNEKGLLPVEPYILEPRRDEHGLKPIPQHMARQIL